MVPRCLYLANPEILTLYFIGVNVILFGVACAVLIGRESRTKGSGLPIFALTCWMFGLVTVHYALNFNNVYNGLVRPFLCAPIKILRVRP
jgi:hypothetical protein